eukprot:462747-Heterocapsa_arctica.AAC.1
MFREGAGMRGGEDLAAGRVPLSADVRHVPKGGADGAARGCVRGGETGMAPGQGGGGAGGKARGRGERGPQ